MSALMACAARAAHHLVDDDPRVLNDSTGRALCRTVEQSPLNYQLAQPQAPLLAAARLCAVSRSVFTERLLRESGVAQYVVLGAGLDTSAHRVAPGGVRVWLIDRPGVLAWRKHLFALAGLTDVGTPVGCDVGNTEVVDELRKAGLDVSRPVFVSWLGVSMYLTPGTVQAVFAQLRRLAHGSHMVVDYVLPCELRDHNGTAYAQIVAAAVGANGEPWLSTPRPQDVTDWLTRAGWDTVDDVSEADSLSPGFWPRADSLQPMRLIRFLHATLGDTKTQVSCPTVGV